MIATQGETKWEMEKSTAARIPEAFRESAKFGPVAGVNAPFKQAKTFDGESVSRLLNRVAASLQLETRDSAPAAASSFTDDDALAAALQSLDAWWLKDGEWAALFLIESGSESGAACRKAADLLALFPKLKAPLYLVGDPSAFPALLAEVHRPVHKLLKKPMEEKLHFLSWGKLQAEVEGLGDRLRYLKPEFLEGLADAFKIPSAPAPQARETEEEN